MNMGVLTGSASQYMVLRDGELPEKGPKTTRYAIFGAATRRARRRAAVRS